MGGISGKRVVEIALAAAILLTVFAGIVNAESGQTEENIGVSVLGVPYYENFESGWDGWSADRGVWQVGTPTAGPTSCHNGTQCAGTNLDGNYPPDTDSSLISPSIQLPAVSAGEEIHLRFWQWFSYAANDQGYVQVSVYNASTGLWENWQNVGSAIWQTSLYWSFTDRDLTQFAGQRIRIAFYHTASSAYPYGESTGWYIDDVEITLPADITSPIVTNTTVSQEIPDDTDKEPLWGETAQLNVTVTDESGIASVTVDLSEIGGPAAKPMTNMGENIYSTTTNATAGTPPKLYNLTVNAADTFGNSNTSVVIQLRVMKNGDTTGNELVNIGDALRLANNVSYPGNPAYALSSIYVAEVTGNGAINIGDALRLANNVSYPGDTA
jgi:hypothetical protein